MSAEGYRRKFYHDPEKLEEMIALYREGWSTMRLGKKYGVDHTSIIYWCRKLNVTRDNGVSVVSVESVRVSVDKAGVEEEDPLWYIDEEGGRVCRGRTYEEYLEIEAQRRKATERASSEKWKRRRG